MIGNLSDETIDKVLRLAKSSQDEANSGAQYASMSSIENIEKVLNQPRSEQDGLRKYLNSISFDEVKDIQTVMYLGRDEDYDQGTPEDIFKDQRYYRDSSGWNKQSIEVDQIVGKAPVYDYLLNGFKILGEK